MLQERHAERLWPLVARLMQGQVTPQTIFEFEQELQAVLREMGREILEAVLNRLEVSSHADWPTHVRHEGETYRRRAEATPHEISTLLVRPRCGGWDTARMRPGSRRCFPWKKRWV